MSDARRLIKTDGERLGHIPSFDGFRGIFVVLVVLYHAEITAFLTGSPIIIDWFFVASGFLITSLLLDEHRQSGNIDMRRFYSRRMLRLFPAMYLMLGVVTVLMVTVQLAAPGSLSHASLWWLEVLAAAFYVYYLVAAFFPGRMGVIGHTWSLTVEEHFYFLWPLILGATLRRATRRSDTRLIVGGVIFIAVFIALRVGLQHMIVWKGTEPHYADEGSITAEGVIYRIAAVRPDMIVLGCLSAFVAKAIPRPIPDHIRRILAVLGSIGWALFAFVMLFATRITGFELFGGVGYQVALLFLAPLVLDLYFRPESRIARLLSVRPARWLGLRCYGIYLWHVPVLLPFLALITTTYGIQKKFWGLVAATLGICVGLLSYRYIERRFLKMKEIRFGAPQDRFRRVVEAGSRPVALR